jgi:hypothetical protein
MEYDIVIKMLHKIGEKVFKIQFFWQKVLFYFKIYDIENCTYFGLQYLAHIDTVFAKVCKGLQKTALKGFLLNYVKIFANT